MFDFGALPPEINRAGCTRSWIRVDDGRRVSLGWAGG